MGLDTIRHLGNPPTRGWFTQEDLLHRQGWIDSGGCDRTSVGRSHFRALLSGYQRLSLNENLTDGLLEPKIKIATNEWSNQSEFPHKTRTCTLLLRKRSRSKVPIRTRGEKRHISAMVDDFPFFSSFINQHAGEGHAPPT